MKTKLLERYAASMKEITEKTLHHSFRMSSLKRFTTDYASTTGRGSASHVPVRTARVVSPGRTAIKTTPLLGSLPTMALRESLSTSNSTNVRTAEADFRVTSRNCSTRIATTPSLSLTSVCFMPRSIRSPPANGFSKTSTVSKSIATQSNATPSGSATQSPTATASRSLALPFR